MPGKTATHSSAEDDLTASVLQKVREANAIDEALYDAVSDRWLVRSEGGASAEIAKSADALQCGADVLRPLMAASGGEAVREGA